MDEHISHQAYNASRGERMNRLDNTRESLLVCTNLYSFKPKYGYAHNTYELENVGRERKARHEAGRGTF